MVSEPAENAVRTTSKSEAPSVDQMQFARSVHHRACEALFLLSYEIQVTGQFPDPAVLAQAILHYRESRALLEGRIDEPRAETSSVAGSLTPLLEQFRIP